MSLAFQEMLFPERTGQYLAYLERLSGCKHYCLNPERSIFAMTRPAYITSPNVFNITTNSKIQLRSFQYTFHATNFVMGMYVETESKQ